VAVTAWGVAKTWVLAGALAAAAVAAAQKPDLHGTAANPSAIPNHETTTVTKDGARLAGTTITADGACRLVSYKTTDSLITMVFEGNRALDHDEYCNYQVTNRYGTAHSWIVVNYTNDEERQLAAQKRAADEKKANAVRALSGSEWTLHLSDGDTVRYTRKPGELEQSLAVFVDDHGREMKILVGNDSTVLLIPAEGNCYRTGKLVSGKVVNGISGQACSPGGSWTAEMQ
jgi:hypothetical protein